jgi:hypothetical protein
VLEPLKDFPLNAGPLLLLPLLDERVERSENGTWVDWLLRALELREESLPPFENERDCPDELLREDDDPLLLLLDGRLPWFD